MAWKLPVRWLMFVIILLLLSYWSFFGGLMTKKLHFKIQNKTFKVHSKYKILKVMIVIKFKNILILQIFTKRHYNDLSQDPQRGLLLVGLYKCHYDCGVLKHGLSSLTFNVVHMIHKGYNSHVCLKRGAFDGRKCKS
jgi:hypothetical protein